MIETTHTFRAKVGGIEQEATVTVTPVDGDIRFAISVMMGSVSLQMAPEDLDAIITLAGAALTEIIIDQRVGK